MFKFSRELALQAPWRVRQRDVMVFNSRLRDRSNGNLNDSLHLPLWTV